MKRTFFVALTAAAMLCLACGLSACDDGTTNEEPQTPDTTVEQQSPETSDDPNPTPHVHTYTVQNVCSECNEAWKYTDGLEYVLNTETDTYAVSDIGTASGDIVFPYGHEGKAVTAIEERAFRGCEEMTGVTIPACMTSIGDRAFYGCTELNFIKVSEENTVYRSEENCLIAIRTKTLICGCKNSKIPSGITVIGEDSFYGQSQFTGLVIPNTVTTIGDEAFGYCTGITTLTIPESVTEIGYQVFAACDGIEHIEVADGNPVYRSEQDCLIEKDTNVMLYGCNNSKIPDGVTAVDGAFRELQNLTSIELPASVTEIGFGTFMYCSNLKKVTIHGKLTSISQYAFGACGSLEEIIFDGTVAEWQSIELDPNYYNSQTGDFIVTCTNGTVSRSGEVIS